jgi:hypothetical protein
VEEAVLVAAQQHEVVEVGEAAVGPKDQVVGIAWRAAQPGKAQPGPSRKRRARRWARLTSRWARPRARGWPSRWISGRIRASQHSRRAV